MCRGGRGRATLTATNLKLQARKLQEHDCTYRTDCTRFTLIRGQSIYIIHNIMKRRRGASTAAIINEDESYHEVMAVASSFNFKFNFTRERTRLKMKSIQATLILACLFFHFHNLSSSTIVSAFTNPLQSHTNTFSSAVLFSNDDGSTITLHTPRPRSRIKPKTKQQDTQATTPPWIPNPSDQNKDLLKAQAKYNMHRLNEALERHARFSNSNTSANNRNSLENFTSEDIDTVMEAIYVASKNDYRLIMGAADFLTLLLSVEEYNDSRDRADIGTRITGDENHVWEEEEVSMDGSYEALNDGNTSGDSEYYAVMTRDVLVASAFHYCDCVVARESGIYNIIDNLMWAPNVSSSPGSSTRQDLSKNKALPFEFPEDEVDIETQVFKERFFKKSSSPIKIWESDAMDVDAERDFDTYDLDGISNVVKPIRKANIFKEKDHRIQRLLGTPSSVEEFGQGAARISQSAAKVKKAEIMSHSVLPKSIGKVTLSTADAASRRGLLLSMSSDWRALAIRSSASLYRLKGLLRQQLSFDGLDSMIDNRGQFSSTQVVREAREALNIYAPLAERLGMHRLKSELENTAFRVLYRRQYNTAMSIYAKSGTAIQSVTDFLTEEIEALLNQDAWLAPQLERLTVTSRVKKPYSLWRKLLKARKKSKAATQIESGGISALSRGTPEHLSITSVLDAIAIRVIIKTKKLHTDEGGQGTKSREEFLCYYIQNRLLQVWPELSPGRIKDYISMPKHNGYQSLHHTSKCFRYGCYWPFEVQIRSEDMHVKSEYGVAAHWDYKLESGAKEKRAIALPMIESATGIPKKSPILLENSDENTTDYCMDLKVAGIEDTKANEVKIESLTRSSALKSYTSALSTAREHLINNSLFVFFMTPNTEVQGKVVGLPMGSLVADALIEICERCNLSVPASFGSSDFDVFLNGELANLHDSLNNGDTLMVPSLDSRVNRYL